MPKRWTEDTALVERVACSIVEALPLFPKRIVRIDALTREQSMPLFASRLGVKAVWALSLPGEVAPYSAGAMIRDTVYNILTERGELG